MQPKPPKKSKLLSPAWTRRLCVGGVLLLPVLCVLLPEEYRSTCHDGARVLRLVLAPETLLAPSSGPGRSSTSDAGSDAP